ncbi:hypothetical protein, partial [Staphylococcus aureus]|uniref:hypothetical protein n=1 Tax=Staphylococcus aureus TaxID=1280 RepID=UPI001C534119
FEDEQKEIHRVSVTDLESNTTYPQDVKINKTVERQNSAGREIVSERINSQKQKGSLLWWLLKMKCSTSATRLYRKLFATQHSELFQAIYKMKWNS